MHNNLPHMALLYERIKGSFPWKAGLMGLAVAYSYKGVTTWPCFKQKSITKSNTKKASLPLWQLWNCSLVRNTSDSLNSSFLASYLLCMNLKNAVWQSDMTWQCVETLLYDKYAPLPYIYKDCLSGCYLVSYLEQEVPLREACGAVPVHFLHGHCREGDKTEAASVYIIFT